MLQMAILKTETEVSHIIKTHTHTNYHMTRSTILHGNRPHFSFLFPLVKQHQFLTAIQTFPSLWVCIISVCIKLQTCSKVMILTKDYFKKTKTS